MHVFRAFILVFERATFAGRPLYFKIKSTFLLFWVVYCYKSIIFVSTN